MPIHGDPQNRWWIEIAPQNRELVDLYSRCLLSVIAFGPQLEPALVGSAFVLGAGEGYGLALTARHVLPEGVQRVQQPIDRHAPSAWFVPASRSIPSLDQRKLRVMWLSPTGGDMLNVGHVSYNAALDISAFLVLPQDRNGVSFSPAGILLDTSIPAKGDVVHMISNSRLVLEESQPPGDRDGVGHGLQIERAISVRIGVVTEVYPSGFRQYRWPCFTTSIPALPGMSGGFVSIPRNGQAVAACGVVSADHSDPAALENFAICGESVVACAWPALALGVPTMIGGGISESPQVTLYEMMKLGRLTTAIGGIDHIAIESIEGGFRLHRGTPRA